MLECFVACCEVTCAGGITNELERRDLKKWVLLSVNIFIIVIILVKKDMLYAWISANNTAYFPLVFIMVTMLAIFPFIPFGIIGGLMGAKYGLVWGSIVNIAASTLASIIVYVLATTILHTWGSRLLIKYSFVEKLQVMISRHLFWTVLIARIIPIFPAVAINVYAGVFKLRFSIFILATLLGKIPAMLVFAYVGDGIWSNKSNWTQIILIYGAFLLFLFLIYRIGGLFSIKKGKRI